MTPYQQILECLVGKVFWLTFPGNLDMKMTIALSELRHFYGVNMDRFCQHLTASALYFECHHDVTDLWLIKRFLNFHQVF